MSVEREIGALTEAIERLTAAQQATLDEIRGHVRDDREEFRGVWRAIGEAKVKLAYFAGALGVLTVALEVWLHH